MSAINRFIQQELSGNTLVRTSGHVNVTYVYHDTVNEVLYKVMVNCLGRAVRRELMTVLPHKTAYSELLALVGMYPTARVHCTIVQF